MDSLTDDPAVVSVSTGSDATHTLATQLSGFALDLMTQPVLLLDARGFVLSANAAARAIVSKEDGLLIDGGRFKAKRRVDAARLDAALARAAGRPPEVSTLLVGGPSRARPLQLQVLPYLDGREPKEGPAGLVVFLADLDNPVAPDLERLARLHGLSPTEARVAQALVLGRTPEEVATDLGISVHTVRSHVRAVYMKTDTNRAVDLARVILCGLACLPKWEPRPKRARRR